MILYTKYIFEAVKNKMIYWAYIWSIISYNKLRRQFKKKIEYWKKEYLYYN